MVKKCSSRKLQLLEIIAVSGEVSRHYISSLSTCSKDYIRQNLSELKADNLIKECKFDGAKTYRLTNTGKKFLIDINPDRYNEFFTGVGVANKPRSDPQRRERILRTAQAIMLFRQTDVKIFPDEKHLLYKNSEGTRPDNTDTEFYTSMELKELFVEFKKARGSRALGLLITKSNIYIVYNTGKEPIKWQEQTELKFRIMVENEIARKIFKGEKEIKWLVIGDGYRMPERLLEKSDMGKEKYINIHYDNLSKIFISIQRRKALYFTKMVVDEDFHDYLLKRIKEDYGFKVQGTGQFNDVDEDGYPILYALNLDLKLINDFISYLYNSKQQGNIVTFNNHRMFLSEIKGKVSLGLYHVNTDKYDEEYENA